VLKEKPPQMSAADWAWLNGLKFGGIMFGNPAAGEKTLPARIAKGDLDGDLYFVCWNKDILSHVQPVVDNGCTIEDPEPATQESLDRPWNKQWLETGQELMGDVQRLVNLNKLISQLYKRWKEAFIDQESVGRSLDAVDFGRAYKAALDIGKHGGKVYLPRRLWAEVPKKFYPSLAAE
jgi:RNA dependent RNA polymerase